MKTLIIGGAGFIGCNAARRFLDLGHDVIVFDNLSRRGTELNLAWLRSLGAVAFVQGDITREEEVRSLLQTHGDAGIVLHLAGQVAVTSSVANPRHDFLSNAYGTLNVLEGLREIRFQGPMLFSSTNKVYGSLDHLRHEAQATRYFLPERLQGISEAEPLDFHSPYGCSKGASDQYVRDYARIYGLKTVVFRQSCIYGPRQFGVEDQGWVAWFCIATHFRKSVSIYGDGKQVRDLCHVEDLVDAYLLAAEQIDTAKGEVFNIGGGPSSTLSLLELVEWLERYHGRKLTYRFEPWRPGDQPVFLCDSRKAGERLGWKPRRTLEEGLTGLCEWIAGNEGLFEAALKGK